MVLKKTFDELSSNLIRRLERSRIIKSVRSLLTPSINKMIEWLYLLALFILLGGSVNTALEGMRIKAPQAMIFVSSTVQSIGETIINIFTLILGAASIYFIYRGSRFMSSRRLTSFYLFAGAMGLLIALAIEFYLFAYKR
ncbi:MAG: hypothetical protein ACK4TI_00140 [Nitrososphaerales archaeon]